MISAEEAGATFLVVIQNAPDLAAGMGGSARRGGRTSGVMVDGVVGYDVVGFGSNRGAVTLNLGLGMMIATSINSPPYLKTGVVVTVAEQLTLGYNYLLMLTSTTALKLPSASYFAVGWKF